MRMTVVKPFAAEGCRITSTVPRPAVALVGDGAAHPSRGSVLGLDIGGTKLAAGVVAPDGSVRGFVVAPTRAERGPDNGFGLG